MLQCSAYCLMMSTVVSTQYTSVTHGQTDRHRTTTLYHAIHMRRVVKMAVFI